MIQAAERVFGIYGCRAQRVPNLVPGTNFFEPAFFENLYSGNQIQSNVMARNEQKNAQ